MPYDGTGVYRPPLSPTFPAVGGTVIQADYYNAVINDIAAGLTNAVKRDGQGPWTGAQNAGGKKITNLGEGTLDADATTLKQLRDLVASGTGTLTTNTMVAPAAGEARVGATYTGLEPVYLFSNSVSYGLYSTTGGVLIDYERATGKKRLGGTIDISTLVKNDSGTYSIGISGRAALATLADNATNATNSAALGGSAATNYALKSYVDVAVATTSLAAQTGWRKTPDGFIEQWGYVAGGASGTITFPTPFLVQCYNVMTQLVDSGTNFQALAVGMPTTTGFSLYSQGSAVGIFWRAIGK